MALRFRLRSLASVLEAALLSTMLLAFPVRPAHAAPWLPFGPDGGDARRIANDPHDPTHLYLGTANGWIYETHNTGVNWERVAQVGKRNDLVLDSIKVDPSNSKHIIVGAWVVSNDKDGGIFISYDGGASWINQAEMRGQSVLSLAVSPSDSKIWVAGSLQGVFRSNDGGQRWSRISPQASNEIHEVQSVAIDPADPNVIYAGTWHLPWKTTDGGEHWDNIKNGIIDDSDVFSIIVDPKSPNTVFASACSGIYKSDDAGLKFVKVEGIPTTSRRTRVLLQDPKDLNIVYAGTTQGLYRTEDAGRTWTAKTGTDIIVNDVAIDEADPHHILIATDRGGVFSSDDSGDTFHPSSGGFSTRQITTMKRDSLHPATLYVGVVNDKEFGGVFESDNGGLNWNQQSAGLDGRDVFTLAQAADGTMIAGTSHGLFRLDEADKSWERIDDAPATEISAVAKPLPVHAVATLTRPPVPIGRNHYAEQKGVKPMTAAQKRAALLKAKQGKSKTTAKTTARAASKSTGKTTAASRQAQLLAAKKKAAAAKKAGTSTLRASGKTPARPAVGTAHAAPAIVATAVIADAVPVRPSGFDGRVNVLATAGRVLLAATSEGLLRSEDDGTTWAAGGPEHSADWTFMAAAKQNVIAASLENAEFSTDAGETWVPLQLPGTLSRISAVAIEPTGEMWIGGREGVFVSADGGANWITPKNLYVNSVSSLYYDETTNRVMLTTEGSGTYNGLVFTVQLPERTVSHADTGWTLRFARPVGDHLVAATLYDGIVVQPKMVASPVPTAEKAAR